MKISFWKAALWLFCTIVPVAIHAQEELISLVYPRQGMLLTTTDSTLVLGQIQFQNSRLFINNQRVFTTQDGAFIGYIGIDHEKINADSSLILECRVVAGDSTYTLNRQVKIPLSFKLPDSAKTFIDRNYLFPRDSIWLHRGDRVKITCRATPEANVFFSVINSDGTVIGKDIAMSESGQPDDFEESAFGIRKKEKRGEIRGIYSADYIIHASLKNAIIRFYVKHGNDTVYADSPGRISTWDDSDTRVVELVSEVNNAAVDPGRAYYYFLPKGIRCAVNGKMGNQLRLRLSDAHSAWLPEKNVIYLPLGTPTPITTVSLIRVKKTGQKSVIQLVMSQKIPFRVEQTGERQLQLSLFGGISDTDWIRFDNKNDEVKNISWSQPENDVYLLTVDLNEPHHWGYETAYDGTNLTWTIRHKPKTKGLRGLKVCIDPGHSKDIGATGPRGVTERQANVEVALALKKELESAGATIVMTHSDTSQNLTLYDRVAIANENKCDLFVSIHHNALPDGVNP
ncbi:N-acetylmuramoyl-L-alanine amidase, partial [bacterium]|nr:N-acetylmuramoyl-L-alanine amidase [bacterium]